MIDGVVVRALEPHVDGRGSLTEILRADWPGFTHFGQAILTVNMPGVIRAWHWHRRQTDAIVVVRGRALLPLYDGRAGSPTFRQLDEHIGDGEAPILVVVPPGVLHGYKTLGDEAATIINFPSELYDASAPDEERIPYDDPLVGFDWDRIR